MVFLLLTMAALQVLRLHLAQPRSTPVDSTVVFCAALSGADLPRLQEGSSQRFYSQFISKLGNQRYEAVARVYNEVVPRLAYPRWVEHRRRANRLAAEAYEDLQQRVQALGREAFAALGSAERLSLMEDRGRWQRFVIEEGIARLVADEREKVPDPAGFQRRTDRDSFVEREGFALLPAKDQAELGAAATLAEHTTAEKLAFFDRIGVPALDDSNRNVIAGVQRSELANKSRFVGEHGERDTGALLRRAHVMFDAKAVRCTFTDEARGSLLQGDTAQCTTGLRVGQGSFDSTITAVRVGSTWQVSHVVPDLIDELSRRSR